MQPSRNISQPLYPSTRSPLPAVRVPPSPTCNSHSPTASPANASGFLLTALSNARTNTRLSALSNLRASDKALTLSRSFCDRFTQADLSMKNRVPLYKGQTASRRSVENREVRDLYYAAF